MNLWTLQLASQCGAGCVVSRKVHVGEIIDRSSAFEDRRREASHSLLVLRTPQRPILADDPSRRHASSSQNAELDKPCDGVALCGLPLYG